MMARSTKYFNQRPDTLMQDRTSANSMKVLLQRTAGPYIWVIRVRSTQRSSARSRKASGIVRPRTLAVVRLITRSNLVGCSIGRSAGLVLKLAPTRSATLPRARQRPRPDVEIAYTPAYYTP